MRIDCPHCAAAYEVPDKALARKRLVRCASCGKDWAPAGAGDGILQIGAPGEAGPQSAASAPEAAPAPVPPPAAPAFLARPLPIAPLSQAKSDRGAVLAAWAASVAVLVLAAWSAFAWREPVMHAWPPSARLYKAAGLG